MSSLFFNCLRHFSVKMPFYSVARGRKTGIYLTWPECEAQVKGFTGAVFKKFNTRAEAEQHCTTRGGQPTQKTNISPKPAASTNKRQLSETSSTSSSAAAGAPAKRTKLIELPVRTAPADLALMAKYGDLYFPQDADGYVHVYTDGSCEGNGTGKAIAGLGVYFCDGHTLNTAKPVSGRATNNCGEIQAASEAIRLVSAYGVQKLCINTDSQFVINAVTKWLSGWIRKGWLLASGQPVKNVVDFKELHELLQKHKQMQIKWNYVKAHCGILGNERADELAKQGGKMYRESMLKKLNN